MSVADLPDDGTADQHADQPYRDPTRAARIAYGEAECARLADLALALARTANDADDVARVRVLAARAASVWPPTDAGNSAYGRAMAAIGVAVRRQRAEAKRNARLGATADDPVF